MDVSALWPAHHTVPGAWSLLLPVKDVCVLAAVFSLFGFPVRVLFSLIKWIADDYLNLKVLLVRSFLLKFDLLTVDLDYQLLLRPVVDTVFSLQMRVHFIHAGKLMGTQLAMLLVFMSVGYVLMIELRPDKINSFSLPLSALVTFQRTCLWLY